MANVRARLAVAGSAAALAAVALLPVQLAGSASANSSHAQASVGGVRPALEGVDPDYPFAAVPPGPGR
jgi:hypothetical protein